MDTRAALVRRPTSTCRHSRRFVAGASSRHESLLPKGKTFLTVAEETRAHVQLVVASCWCEPPHKRKRASHELASAHSEARQDTERPTIQPQTRARTTQRQSQPNVSQDTNRQFTTWCRTWITVRFADTANTYDTTHILRLVSIGQLHVPLSPRRSGAVTDPH